MPTFEIELTDTFGGEANYSWVRRYTLEGNDSRDTKLLVRKALRILRENHVASVWYAKFVTVSDYGDTVRIDNKKACYVAFISYVE